MRNWRGPRTYTQVDCASAEDSLIFWRLLPLTLTLAILAFVNLRIRHSGLVDTNVTQNRTTMK